MTEQERLLKEAQERYPIGTRYKSLVNSDDIIKVSDTWNWIRDVLTLNNGQRHMYQNGMWAEIISRPETLEYPTDVKYQKGDKIKVLRSAKNHERGWKNSWVSTMNSYVGTVKIVHSDNGIKGVTLEDAGGYSYPHFVLEKISEDKPQFEVGKWYRIPGNKFIGKLTSSITGSVFPSKEYINEQGEYKASGTCFSSSDWLTKAIEVPLSEIQQYLPKDHPDLIPVKQDTMKELTELPENWGIKITQENKEHLNKWRGSLSRSAGSTVDYSMIDGYLLNKSGDYTGYFVNDLSSHSNYSEITFDQFKRWVLKESDTLKVEDLVEGEIYWTTYSGNSFIFKFEGNTSAYISDLVTYRFSSSSWDFWKNSKDLRKATDEEKQWLQNCIAAGKFISLADSKLLTSSTDPEYYECMQPSKFQNCIKINGGVIFHKDFDDYIGKPISNTAKTNRSLFKPSTKEAYDAQFVKEEKVIEQWIPQVGDWCVRLNDDHGNVKIGNVRKIIALDGNQPILENDIEKYSHTPVNLRKALPHEIPQSSIDKTVKVHVPFKLENGEWDMKAVQDECKKRYPIGCRFRTFSAHTLKKDGVVYSIHGNCIYAHQMAGSLFDDGRWVEIVTESHDHKIIDVSAQPLLMTIPLLQPLLKV